MDIYLKRISPKQAPTIGLYGAGGRAESAYAYIVREFPNATIVVFDSYAQGIFMGKNIHSLENYDLDLIDFFVVASSYHVEITEQLIQKNVECILLYQKSESHGLFNYNKATYPNTRSARYITNVQSVKGGIEIHTESYEKTDDSKPVTTEIMKLDQTSTYEGGGAKTNQFSFFDIDVDCKEEARPEQWTIATLSPQHESFIDEIFDLPSGRTDTLQKADSIMSRIIGLTKNNRGHPSSRCNAMHPIEQLQSVMQDTEKVWCSNLSNIFSYVCKYYGIICRTICLGNSINLNNKVLSYASGHMTTEIYSPEKQQWVWVDLTLGIHHALLCKEIYLSFFDFMGFFNSIYDRKISLMINQDNETDEMVCTPIQEFSNYQALVAYFNHNQHYSYTVQDPYSS